MNRLTSHGDEVRIENCAAVTSLFDCRSECPERSRGADVSRQRQTKRASLPTDTIRNRGSVLIDVMAGTVIIAMVVITLFLSLSLANRIALRTKHIAIAKGAAETEIEETRSTDYDSLAIGTTTETVATLPDGEKTIEIAYYDPPDNEVKEITVTVTWRERQGTESFTLTTLATSGGTGL